VADRRSQIQQRQRATFEAVGGKKGGAAAAAAPGALPLSHYKDTLAAANLLAGLVDPAGGAGGDDVNALVGSQVRRTGARAGLAAQQRRSTWPAALAAAGRQRCPPAVPGLPARLTPPTHPGLTPCTPAPPRRPTWRWTPS
jgi:hypothetical protein